MIGAAPSNPDRLFGFGKSPSGQDAVLLFGHEIPVTMLLVLATALGAFLVFRARASGSSVVSAGTPAAAPAAAPATYSSTGYDPNAQAIADLQTAVTDLAAQVQPQPTSPATSTAPTASSAAPSLTDLSSEVLSGYGWNPPAGGPFQVLTTPAGSFQWVSSAGAAYAAEQAGAQLYYQPEPGAFQPVSYATWAKSMPGTTALYAGVPTPQQPLPTTPTASQSSPTLAGLTISTHPLIPAGTG